MNDNLRRPRVEITVKADPGTEVIFRSKAANKQHKLPVTVQGKVDPWSDAVARYLINRKELSGIQIAVDCLKLEASDYTKAVQMRIAEILKSLDWKAIDLWKAGKTMRCWVPIHGDTLDTKHVVL